MNINYLGQKFQYILLIREAALETGSVPMTPGFLNADFKV